MTAECGGSIESQSKPSETHLLIYLFIFIFFAFFSSIFFCCCFFFYFFNCVSRHAKLDQTKKDEGGASSRAVLRTLLCAAVLLTDAPASRCRFGSTASIIERPQCWAPPLGPRAQRLTSSNGRPSPLVVFKHQ